MEQLGHEPDKIYGSLHAPGFTTSSNTIAPAGVSLTDEYHVYSVLWSEGRIEWFLDWKSYAVKTANDVPAGGEWVFEHPFFLLLNLAIGGNFPGNPDSTTVFPQTLYIDYVRVRTMGPEPPRYLGAFSDKPGEIALSWTMASAINAPVIAHELERAEDSEFTVNYLQRRHDATAYVVDDGLVPGKEYFYRVATVTAEGVSSFSSPAFARVSGPDHAQPGGNLINCSTRAVVGGDAPAIAGFVVDGAEPRRVLVRAIGPTLRDYGVSDALPDPVLTLRPLDSQHILATNDNWEDRPERPEIVATSAAIGAFPLDAASRDAAILITLPPGGYTAVIEARDGQKGVVLAEIYETR
ncbi:MAG: fibronectin type III domain-containing protein [Opitutaceae bacterium]